MKMSVKSPFKTSPSTLDTAQKFLAFINASPSPFHAVANVNERLKAQGFEQLHERDVGAWKLKPNGKYFVNRNQSATIAFAIGGKCELDKKEFGFEIIGAHTDSPCLKVKPISTLKSEGYLQVGVECYGGGLFHTWFDRDLGLAGRVFVQKTAAQGSPCVYESKLVLINRPIMRIPTLAIHLDREVSEKFTFNRETQLRPILATEVRSQLEKCDGDTEESNPSVQKRSKHHSALLQLLARELNVTVNDIRDFELCLFDTQGGNVGGIYNEFIFAPRLDNLCCSWVSVEALVASLPTLGHATNVRVVALFDNEEVGSDSLMGAGSNFMQQTMERIAGEGMEHKGSGTGLASSICRRSLLISADMAHGVHPNYADKHEVNHRPAIHGGPVIKYNANQRYATSGETAFLLKELARSKNAEIQEFMVRQDTGCGSTIGPILATSTGIRTIDVGIAQLSMHSIREMCGTEDLEKTLTLFEAFYSGFASLDAKLNASL